jgi:hypothetical protein
MGSGRSAGGKGAREPGQQTQRLSSRSRNGRERDAASQIAQLISFVQEPQPQGWGISSGRRTTAACCSAALPCIRRTWRKALVAQPRQLRSKARQNPPWRRPPCPPGQGGRRAAFPDATHQMSPVIPVPKCLPHRRGTGFTRPGSWPGPPGCHGIRPPSPRRHSKFFQDLRRCSPSSGTRPIRKPASREATGGIRLRSGPKIRPHASGSVPRAGDVRRTGACPGAWRWRSWRHSAWNGNLCALAAEHLVDRSVEFRAVCHAERIGAET